MSHCSDHMHLLLTRRAFCGVALWAGSGTAGRAASPHWELRFAGAAPSVQETERPIINVHEHIESFDQAKKLLRVMDRMGIEKTVLLGSSWFTITLDQRVGFTRYDWNNEQLMRIVASYPGCFEAWPTMNPLDADKLEKFKALVERGATGLKLYLGHGVIEKATGEYFFHKVALDDAGMLPVYAYCQERFIPVCVHVNPGPRTPGFAEEFIAMLEQFPDLKVNCPHFMLSSIADSRLREFLATFPNLYTDVSFGYDTFLREGLLRISRRPNKFRDLFGAFPDRIMFGTDTVVTAAAFKDEQWFVDRFQAYLDMLSKDTYTTPLVPGRTLNGLALSEYLLRRVLRTNYEEFMARRPVGTRITRSIDWNKMGIEKINRTPGVASQPPRSPAAGAPAGAPLVQPAQP